MYKPHSTMVLSQYIFIRDVKIKTKYKTFNTKHNRDYCQMILKNEKVTGNNIISLGCMGNTGWTHQRRGRQSYVAYGGF